jgi:AcrR family transcriptional regulator
MHRVSETVKRYRSRVREEAALRTRRLIRDAAVRLFVEDGVAATTMRQIAAEAGVAERTVYTVFPTKADLFKQALDVATVGDEAQVAVADRPAFTQVMSERDPNVAVRQLVDYGVDLLERAGDLLMTAAESAGADPAMRAIVESGSTAMSANMRTVAAAWSRNGLLRPGLSADEAGAVLYSLCGAHVHHLLRRRQGWSVEQYRGWLVDTLLRTVLVK